MEHKRIWSSSFFDQQDDPPQTSSDLNNPPDSPLSGDDTRATAATTTITTSPPPPHKKSKRGIKKRVVSVPIRELNGSRSSSSKGDAYPPSDSWAWRKYGQKPIKGSHYPRAYYRCSSSKGCPARKQVERSHVDPTILVITYASDHNHTAPTSKHHQHHHRYNNNNNNSPTSSTPTTPEAAAPTNSSDAEVAAATSPTTATDNIPGAKDDIPASSKELLIAVDGTTHHDFEMDNGDTLLLGAGTCDHFSWLSDVVSFDDVPSLVGPRCEDVDMAMLPVMREEDELLFADLGELPECSVVFGRGRGMEIKV